MIYRGKFHSLLSRFDGGIKVLALFKSPEAIAEGDSKIGQTRVLVMVVVVTNIHG